VKSWNKLGMLAEGWCCCWV